MNKSKEYKVKYRGDSRNPFTVQATSPRKAAKIFVNSFPASSPIAVVLVYEGKDRDPLEYDIVEFN